MRLPPWAASLGALVACASLCSCSRGEGVQAQPPDRVGTIDQQLTETTIRIENYVRGALPASVSGSTGTNGRLARVTDDSLGIWFDNGSGTSNAWVSASGAVFNVKDFGAKGDFSLDDGPPDAGECTGDDDPIQNAVHAAEAAGGGKVYLPRGVYRLCGSVLISGSNISFSGDGDATTVVTEDVSAFVTPIWVLPVDKDIENVHIHDLHFVGRRGFNNPKTPSPSAITLGQRDRTAPHSLTRSGVARVHFEKLNGPAIQFLEQNNDIPFFEPLNYAIDNIIEDVPGNGINTNGNMFYSFIACGNRIRYASRAFEFTGAGGIICNNVIENSRGIDVVITTTSPSPDKGWILISSNIFKETGLRETGRVWPTIQLTQVNVAMWIKIVDNVFQNIYGTAINGVANNLIVENNIVDGFGYQSGSDAGAKPLCNDGNDAGDNCILPQAPWVGIALANYLNVRVIDNHVICHNGPPDWNKCEMGIFTGLDSQTSWSNGNTVLGEFSDTPIRQSGTIGHNGVGSNSWFGTNIDLTHGTIAPAYTNANVMTRVVPTIPRDNGVDDAGAGSIASSIAGWDGWIVDNATPTVLANLKDGVPGQKVTLVFNHAATTVNDAPPFALNGNFVSTTNGNDSLVLVWTGSVWAEIKRTHN